MLFFLKPLSYVSKTPNRIIYRTKRNVCCRAGNGMWLLIQVLNVSVKFMMVQAWMVVPKVPSCCKVTIGCYVIRSIINSGVGWYLGRSHPPRYWQTMVHPPHYHTSPNLIRSA